MQDRQQKQAALALSEACIKAPRKHWLCLCSSLRFSVYPLIMLKKDGERSEPLVKKVRGERLSGWGSDLPMEVDLWEKLMCIFSDVFWSIADLCKLYGVSTVIGFLPNTLYAFIVMIGVGVRVQLRSAAWKRRMIQNLMFVFLIRNLRDVLRECICFYHWGFSIGLNDLNGLCFRSCCI